MMLLTLLFNTDNLSIAMTNIKIVECAVRGQLLFVNYAREILGRAPGFRF